MKIKLENCNKTYIKNGIKNHVLKDLSYEFEPSTFYAIMGESGSGKSTLINILAGLLKFDTGNLKFNNKIYHGDVEFSKLRLRSIGLVYQSYLLNEQMTAIENVMLPLCLNNDLAKKEKILLSQEKLKIVGLSNKVEHFPKELSGGEQQRVAVARALINNPEIILADEPTGNLDIKNEKDIFEMLKKESIEGKCVIVVSHNPFIKKYADKLLILENGELYEK